MRTPRWLPLALMLVAIACFVAVDVANPQIDWIQKPVSRLVHYRQGWLVPVAIVAAAAGTAAGHDLLRRRFQDSPDRRTGFAVAFLGVAALGLLVAAIVPADPIGAGPMSWREVVHGGAGWIGMLGFPAAAFALRARLRSVPLTVLAGAATLLTLAIVATWLRLTQTADAFGFGTHRTSFGLIERAAMYVDFVWLGLACLRATSPAVAGYSSPVSVAAGSGVAEA